MMAPIEWFDDLTVGMRFKSGEAQITASDIKRFAVEFDPSRVNWRHTTMTVIGWIRKITVVSAATTSTTNITGRHSSGSSPSRT